MRYIIRLDDASEYWDREKWDRMHELLSQYGIKPIFAIIPHNEDVNLTKYEVDSKYAKTILEWIDEGWTPALHGYNHVLSTSMGGINPVNKKSEFAGLPLHIQEEKIIMGNKILSDMGINAEVFVAPAHTFDNNTLLAIKKHTTIRVISDTIAKDVYFDNDFFFIPQQSGQVRTMKTNVTTFCYHPNTTTDEQFVKLEKFLKIHAYEFGKYDDIVFTRRKKDITDKILSTLYFTRRKILLALKMH